MTYIESMFDLTGKTAIVTGGSRGLGFAIAEALHNAGAEIVLIASNKERLKAVADALGKDGAAVHYAASDLSVTANIENVYKTALDKLGGKLDVLVNSAGIQHRCKAEEFPLEKWNNVLDINLDATFVFCQLAGRTMLEQGRGKIINIASMTSFFGSVMIPAYAASKGAVMQLTKALSNEWAGRGITVNAIAPGYMETALTANMKSVNIAQYQEVTSRIPAGRWGNPEDLHGIAVFLASDASNYISGAIIPVDGGYLGK